MSEELLAVLSSCEGRVHQALHDINEHGAFVESAMLDGALALHKAYVDEAYKSKTKTFEAWALTEFGLGKRTAYNWIGCAKVHLALTTGECKLLPDTQEKYRLLDIVPDEQQATVWDSAVAKAKSDQPTKGQVAAAIDDVLGPPVEQPKPAPTEPEPVKDELGRVVPDDLLAIFTQGRSNLWRIAKELAYLVKQLREVRKELYGEHIPQSVVTSIANARKSILWAIPYAVVSEALKAKVAEGDQGAKMEELVKLGWMPKEIHERLPENLR